MKTYTLDILQAADEEMVTTILEALARRAVIQFSAAQPWHSRPPASAQELEDRITAADQQPRISFAEARQRLGV